MSVRKKTPNRLTLYRTCHTCGKSIVTTADTPWIRQLPNIDGKKQKTCYFCSESCFKKSYKYIGYYDGLAWKRREEKEKNRDVKEKNRRYYEKNKEKIKEKRRKYYQEHREQELESNKYHRKKRKLLQE